MLISLTKKFPAQGYDEVVWINPDALARMDALEGGGAMLTLLCPEESQVAVTESPEEIRDEIEDDESWVAAKGR